MNGASLAIAMSDIPWNGPIAGVFVGLVDGEIVSEPHEGAARAQRPLPDAGRQRGKDRHDRGRCQRGRRGDHDDVPSVPVTRRSRRCSHSSTASSPRSASRKRASLLWSSTTPCWLTSTPIHLEDVKAAMNTDDKNVRDAAMLPIMDAIAAEHPELTAADLDLISYKLQKIGRPHAGCWRTASASMAAASTRSARWPPRSVCCPVCTAPACSPAARPRC